MAGHHDGVVSDAEEVQLDGAKQSELVWVLGLELLRGLEAVGELRRLLVAQITVRSGVDAVHHLHLHASKQASRNLIAVHKLN